MSHHDQNSSALRGKDFRYPPRDEDGNIILPWKPEPITMTIANRMPDGPVMVEISVNRVRWLERDREQSNA